ncbi:Adenylate cyclase 1 [Diplonema papillatum]|nr:Adenylate cyclase 1 [Diplonema papillatum]
MRRCVPLYRALRQHVERPGDGPTQLARKRKMVPVLVAIALLMLLSMAGLLLTQTRLVFVYLACTEAVVTACCFAHILLKKEVTDGNVLLWLLVSIACIFAADVATLQDRYWILLILCSDFVMASRLGPTCSTAVLGVTIGWLVVTHLELSTRFGLYDTSVSPSYADRRAKFLCDKPPCVAEPTENITTLVVSCLLVLVDHAYTRSFANRLYAEQERTAKCVSATMRVAEFLADFDLREAEQSLEDDACAVPKEFKSALQHLLSNLKHYRPFLPQSCFQNGGSEELSSFASDETSLNSAASTVRTRTTLSSGTPLARASDLGTRPSFEKSFILLRKVCTVAVINVRSSLDFLLHSSGAHTYPSMQVDLLTTSVQAISSRSGMIDTFMGDRIMASWNTSKNCTAHRSMAASSACSINEAMTRAIIRVHVGLATGSALCGNCGVPEIARYHIIGSVVSTAHDLVKVARDWNLAVVAPTSVQREIAWTHVTQVIVERVCLPKDRGSARGVILWEVLRENDTAAEEWMYVIESNDTQDLAAANDLAAAFLKGDTEDVQRRVNSLTTSDSMHASPYLAHVFKCMAMTVPEGTTSLPVVTPNRFPLLVHQRRHSKDIVSSSFMRRSLERVVCYS